MFVVIIKWINTIPDGLGAYTYIILYTYTITYWWFDHLSFAATQRYIVVDQDCCLCSGTFALCKIGGGGVFDEA